MHRHLFLLAGFMITRVNSKEAPFITLLTPWHSFCVEVITKSSFRQCNSATSRTNFFEHIIDSLFACFVCIWLIQSFFEVVKNSPRSATKIKLLPHPLNNSMRKQCFCDSFTMTCSWTCPNIFCPRTTTRKWRIAYAADTFICHSTCTCASSESLTIQSGTVN